MSTAGCSRGSQAFKQGRIKNYLGEKFLCLIITAKSKWASRSAWSEHDAKQNYSYNKYWSKHVQVRFDRAEHTGGQKILHESMILVQKWNYFAQKKQKKSACCCCFQNVNVKYSFGFYPNYKQKRTHTYFDMFLVKEGNEKWGKEVN